MSPSSSPVQAVLSQVARRAEAAGVFDGVELREEGPMLVCLAKEAASPASYRVWSEEGRLWVALVMADRWLSGSIESDLVHTGDKLEDLLEEELVDLGYRGEGGKRPTVQHFRSGDLLFTFRTPVPEGPRGADAAETAAQFLLAYEACFRNLGDMSAGEGEE